MSTLLNGLLGRPRLLLLIVGLLALVGLASFLNMPRQEDPTFPNRGGLITVLYPGAVAETIERLIIEPLEDELGQVEEIDTISATARTGVALLNIGLHDNLYNTDPAWDRVRHAMQRAQARFPAGVGNVELDDRQTGIPVAVLAVRGAPSVLELSRAAEELKRVLRGLPGLSRIELEGKSNEQITIALRDAELQSLGLTPQQLASVLATRNQVSPGGFLHVDGRRVALLSNNEFETVDALRHTQIPLASGASVPLGAVADIWREPVMPADPATWFDGERVVLLAVYAQADVIDAIRFGEMLRERIAQVQAEFSPLEITEMFFQPDEVESRLSGLLGSLLLSIVIIMAVILLGMGWRMGLLVATMLPMVTLISLGLYDLGGGTLHQIAVIGMVISLGILIDNAIVMVENIQHRLNQGLSRMEAMQQSVRELAGPLGTSTGTTLAAFMPLLLSSGGTADFTRGIPVMIMLTLSISYLLAISVAPLLAAWGLKPMLADKNASSETAGRSLIDSLGAALAGISQRWPRLIVLSGLVIVTISLSLLPQIPVQFFPNADRAQVVVDLFLPEGTDQARTEAVATELEFQIRQQSNVENVHRFVGSSGPSFYYNLPNATQAPNRGRLVVNTTDLASTGPLLSWLRRHVAQQVPELDIIAGTLQQGPPRAAPVEIRLYHSDDTVRRIATEQVFTQLKNITGAVDVRHDMDLGVPAVRLVVDDAAAARFGLTRSDIAQTLFGQSFGLIAEEYRQELDPIPLVLRSPEGTALTPARLLSAYAFNSNGDAVPLSAVTRSEIEWQVAGIQRRDGARVYRITAGLDEGRSFSQILDVLNTRLAAEPLPEGVRMELGGDQESSGDANRAIFTTAPAGLLLLLFFLVLQFNSYRRVAIVLLTVPLAAAGVFPGLLLSGSPFGFQPLLGVIALVGIVVNNAIVLIDRMDLHLREGMGLDEAVSRAVARRTRPILLTTATTVAGLLPLALSSSTLWPPMAWAIISGLLAATIQTLLVIPAVCRLALRKKPLPQTIAGQAVGSRPLPGSP